jgi:hypothetical protein
VEKTGKRSGAAFAALIISISAALWLVRWYGTQPRAMGDSYWYVRATLIMSGESDETASRRAAQMRCNWGMHEFRPPGQERLTRVDCNKATAGRVSPRYSKIFSNRIGYPALGAVLSPIFGNRALPVATLLCAVLASLALAWAMLLAGSSRLAATLGVVFLFALPSGTWLAPIGTEAPAASGLLFGLAGLLLCIQHGRLSTGAALWAGSSVWLMAVRPPSAVAFACASAVAVAVIALRRRSQALAAAAAGAAGSALAESLFMHITHAPGLTTTLQDTFTAHFTQPDVTNLLGHWWDKFTSTWLYYLWYVFGGIFGPLLIIAGLVALLWHYRWDALPWLTLGAVGVLAAVVHPVYSEMPRLLSPGSAVVAAGLAEAIASALQRRRRLRATNSAKPPLWTHDPTPIEERATTRG